MMPVVVALLSFTGCTLIDQRTFAPSPEAKAQPAPAVPAVAIDARTPLLTIDYTVASPDYGELLHYAVRAAENRDPNVQYDVIAVMKDMSEASEGPARAAGGRRGIMGEGGPPSRIRLGLRSDPGLAASQVRVYVR